MKIRKAEAVADHEDGSYFVSPMTVEQLRLTKQLLAGEYSRCNMCGFSLDKEGRREVIPETSVKNGLIKLRSVCGGCFDDFKRTWKMFAGVMTVNKSIKDKTVSVCGCVVIHQSTCPTFHAQQASIDKKPCMCVGKTNEHSGCDRGES